MTRRVVVLAILLLAVAASTGCGLATNSPGTPTATASVAPTIIPLPGGGTVDPTDEVVVYTSAADDSGSSATSTAGTKTPPVRIVHVYDITQDKPVASLPFGTHDEPPVRAVLAGNQLVTATEHRVVVQRLDGSTPRQVYAAPPTGEVLDIDATRDGRLLAIVARSEKENPLTAIVRVSYLSSGGQALTMAIGDPRLRGFQGTFATVHWQAGADKTPSFIVAGTTTEEGHTPSNAVISLHGIVAVQQPSGPPWLAPSGTRWALTDHLVCTGARTAGHRLVIRDVGSDTVLWQSSDDTPLYTPVEWSPDGTALIYATRPDAQTSCDTSIQSPVQLYEVDLASGETTAIADLTALHQQWYGQSLITAQCDAVNPIMDRWQHYNPLCASASDAEPVTISVGGTDIGTARNAVPVGVIQPPSNPDQAISARSIALEPTPHYMR